MLNAKTQGEYATAPVATAVTSVLLSILLAVSMKKFFGQPMFLPNANGVGISGGEFHNVNRDVVKNITIVNNPARDTG
jgi:hypothetical protein